MILRPAMGYKSIFPILFVSTLNIFSLVKASFAGGCDEPVEQTGKAGERVEEGNASPSFDGSKLAHLHRELIPRLLPTTPTDLKDNRSIQMLNGQQGISKTAKPEDIAEFKSLVRGLIPRRGAEFNYIVIGGLIDDQGVGMTVMAMGDILGLWKVVSPFVLNHPADESAKVQMARSGMIFIVNNADFDELVKPFLERRR